MSVSETHNLANLRMPREQSFAALAEVIRLVDGRTPINVSLSTCFGCPMEGDMPPRCCWAGALPISGVRGLTICDTTGMAHPAQVARLVEALQQANLPRCSSPCISTTRAAWVGQRAGRRAGRHHRFDGSLGGLGGCPYAPGASGNISSEDAIHMLDAMGYDTGIDLHRLLAVARQMPQIVGHDVPGQVAKAGRITDLHPAPRQLWLNSRRPSND
jgi:hydroxymethylglutaryl-CoA lyase